MILVLISLPNPTFAQSTTPSNLNTGPYVDEIVYVVIPRQDDQVLALQSGAIEMHMGFIDPSYLPTLDMDPSIDIYSALRNGYGHITINCRKYPLNISAFRRAFAFAFDKTEVAAEVMQGFSQVHDSLVPYANGWCVEEDFEWHYYTNQADIGNQILDNAGFIINASSGYRLAPDGSPFEVLITYADYSELAGGVAQIGADALQALHVNATPNPAEFNEYISILDAHGDFDMAFYSRNFYSNDVDWLAYDYWSEYSVVPYQNPTNFVNATYDSWRDQLLYGTSYEEVYEAAAEMQKILHYNVPVLVAYQNTYIQAYRNDALTGHVQDLSRYISGPWTMRKIHRLDGTMGGIVFVGIGEEQESFNVFVARNPTIRSIFDELYPSLFKYGPDMVPHTDLARQMFIDTHDDNPSISEGHTRFTIDLIENATWSDGTPLTAEDVANSFTYIVESGAYGNPQAVECIDLVAAYAPLPYRVVLEYNTESYWHFSNFAFDYIFPRHIFHDVDGEIGYEEWNTWNPVIDPEHHHVTSGPFILTEYNPGEYILAANEDFRYYPTGPPPDHTASNPTDSTTPTGNPFEPISPITLATTVISGTSVIIIVLVVFEIIRHKQGITGEG